MRKVKVSKENHIDDVLTLWRTLHCKLRINDWPSKKRPSFSIIGLSKRILKGVNSQCKNAVKFMLFLFGICVFRFHELTRKLYDNINFAITYFWKRHFDQYLQAFFLTYTSFQETNFFTQQNVLEMPPFWTHCSMSNCIPLMIKYLLWTKIGH